MHKQTDPCPPWCVGQHTDLLRPPSHQSRIMQMVGEASDYGVIIEQGFHPDDRPMIGIVRTNADGFHGMKLELHAAVWLADTLGELVGQAEAEPEPHAPSAVRKGCPSEGQYRRHLKAGEQCQQCRDHVRDLENARRRQHPEWEQRKVGRRRRLAQRGGGSRA